MLSAVRGITAESSEKGNDVLYYHIEVIESAVG
jgi:hypothetical protein